MVSDVFTKKNGLCCCMTSEYSAQFCFEVCFMTVKSHQVFKALVFQQSLYCLSSKKALCSKICSRTYRISLLQLLLFYTHYQYYTNLEFPDTNFCYCGSFNHEYARWLSQSLANLRQHPKYLHLSLPNL